MHSQNNQPSADASKAMADKQVGTLSRQQKYALVFLCSFVLVIMGAAMYNFKKVLKSSEIKAPQQEIPTDNVVVNSQNLASADKSDTDKDGLSDYDERNIYRTSAYLSDTDGDGSGDGDEIKSGSDPLCAAGQNCANTTPVTNKDWSGAGSSSAAVSGNVAGDFTPEQLQQMQLVQQLSNGAAPTQSSGLPGASDSQAQTILNGQADAATLRASLISSGIPKADLDKISDDILLKNYSELLAQQNK